MSFILEAVIPPHGTLCNVEATGNDDCPRERDLAVVQATEAVKSLLKQGVIGASSHPVLVRINGHVNPNNEPREGWTPDFLIISISQMKGE